MTTSPSPTTHDGDIFVCECDERLLTACIKETFYKVHDGKRYCVLHYPSIEKKEDFQKAHGRKISEGDFDFRGVWFPDGVSFEDFTFIADADFSGAQFSTMADFRHTQFSSDSKFSGAKFTAGADFSRSQFSAGANFSFAQFRATSYFVNAVFNGSVYFRGTTFSEKDGSLGSSVSSTTGAINTDDRDKAKSNITEIVFFGTRFKDEVSFVEDKFVGEALLSFAGAVFEKPERVAFNTVALCPHWFLNVDSRKLSFMHVKWGSLNSRHAVRKEIKALENRPAKNTSPLLTITLGQLAFNAEENSRYEEAASLRYMAMRVKRIERGFIKYFFSLSWLYWALSGYGERVVRASVALLVIWLLFAVSYWSGDATWWQPKQASNVAAESNSGEKEPSAVAERQGAAVVQPLTIPDALIYSVSVMALQKPEPLPANKRAKVLVLFETVLGPLQAALLALAIRRKFMR